MPTARPVDLDMIFGGTPNRQPWTALHHRTGLPDLHPVHSCSLEEQLSKRSPKNNFTCDLSKKQLILSQP